MQNINFTEGSFGDKLIWFVLPLAFSSIIQQLFHSADTAVVGQFVGKEALAAVGSTAPIVNLFIEFFSGLSVGSNVVIARYIGKNDVSRVQAAVHTAVCVALISGVTVAAAGVILIRPLLVLVQTPADIIELSADYLRIYFIGMPFLMLNNFCGAIFRSNGETKKPLYCLSIAGAINVILNLVFVLYLKAGVSGTAWATVISNGISASCMIVLLLHQKSIIHLDLRHLRIDGDILGQLVRIGLPSGFLGSVFSVSNVITQSAINSLGTNVVSASGAAVSIEIYLQFFGNAFAQAATTAISQNYGAKQYKRCTQAVKVSLFMCVLITIALSTVVFGFGRQLLRIFVTDAAVITIAMTRMKYTVVFKFIQAGMDIMSGSLQGYGYTLVPALISVFGVCGVRLFWICFVFPKYQTLEMLMLIYPITQSIAVLSYVICHYWFIRHRMTNTT